MKILYAIQGTGNGHLMRAAELIPAFRAVKTLEVDLLVSGTQHQLELPYPVKYRLNGLSFVFGKTGGIDYYATFKMLNSRRFIRDVIGLPVREYDLVISDFEPVASRAAMLRGVPCIALSNQAAVLHPSAPKPMGTDPSSKFLLRHYAPSHKSIGFHYQSFDSRTFTPIIRREVRGLQTARKGHYCLYLPAYSDENILRTLRQLTRKEWHVFSKSATQTSKHDNVFIHPLDGKKFLEHLATCDGMVCNAGFGTTSEALYLGKKMLVIPMKRQCEQQCNAAMLDQMGVSVFGSFRPGNAASIQRWINTGAPIRQPYANQNGEIVQLVLQTHREILEERSTGIPSEYYPIEWTIDGINSNQLD